jgi:polysaccharide export outer membrane protein
VNVYGYPDLGSPAGTLGAKLQGSRVDGEGYIHLPMVGSVKVSGLTVGEIQKRLQKAFRNYIKKPWVVVEVVEYRSQPLYLLGQFNMPGTVYMDRPLKLLQGIALGKGFTEAASLHGARLLRNNRIVPVDIYEILTEGMMEQNVWLRPQDTVYIPDARSQKVFVFGEVEKPGPIPMVSGEMSLVEALATAGIGNRTYDHKIRIIRSLSTTKGELIVIDLDKVLNGNALPYPLREGDIVYVPKSGIGSWNQAIKELLPTLQLVSGVLEPFVQIKFLRE